MPWPGRAPVPTQALKLTTNLFPQGRPARIWGAESGQFHEAERMSDMSSIAWYITCPECGNLGVLGGWCCGKQLPTEYGTNHPVGNPVWPNNPFLPDWTYRKDVEECLSWDPQPSTTEPVITLPAGAADEGEESFTFRKIGEFGGRPIWAICGDKETDEEWRSALLDLLRSHGHG